MKNIIKSIVYILPIFLLFISCEKELEYGTDYQFEILNIDNNAIQIDTYKDFSVFLKENIDANNSKDFKIKFKVTSGQAQINYGNTIVMNEIYNDYIFNEENLLLFRIKPVNPGSINVKVTLQNIDGIEKSKDFILICSDNDFQYDFSAAPGTQEGIIYQDRPISLTINNTGQSNDNNFRIKYTSDKQGTFKVGNTLLTPNTFFNVSTGLINCTYNGTVVGMHNIVITCINSANESKQANLTMSLNATPFSLVKEGDFAVKETLKKEFKFFLSNTLPNTTYMVKFESLTNAKTYSGGTINPSGAFIPLTLNQNGIYSFDYEPISNTDDTFKVSIKDSNGQEKAIIYNVDVISKPVVNTARMESNYPYYTVRIAYTIYNNANYTDYEFQKQKPNLSWSENITLNNVNGSVYSFTGRYQLTTGTFWSEGPGSYRFRFKDSDGAWSDWAITRAE